MRLFPAPDGVVDGDDLAGWLMAPFRPAFLSIGAFDMRATLPPSYDGPLHVSWDLGGGRAESSFWAETRRRETASGSYLADELAGMPSGKRAMAASVPTTISPLEFLLKNCLRGDGMLVRVRAGALGPNALGSRSVSRIRRVTSPHLFILVQVSSPDLGDLYIPPADSDVATPAVPAGVVADAQVGIIPEFDIVVGRPRPDRNP